MSFFPEFLIWLQMEIKFHLNHIECYRINSSHSVFPFFRLIRFFYQWLKCARHFIVHKLKYFYHRVNRVIVLGRDIMCGRSEWWHSSGIEGNPTVFYRLMPGSTSQTNKFHTFYLQQRPDNGDTWADIKVNHPLDYESIKEYNLTIRVEVSHFFLFIFFLHFSLEITFEILRTVLNSIEWITAAHWSYLQNMPFQVEFSIIQSQFH